MLAGSLDLQELYAYRMGHLYARLGRHQLYGHWMNADHNHIPARLIRHQHVPFRRLDDEVARRRRPCLDGRPPSVRASAGAIEKIATEVYGSRSETQTDLPDGLRRTAALASSVYAVADKSIAGGVVHPLTPKQSGVFSLDASFDYFVKLSPVARYEGARAVRVFISSTFRDMHAEREVLVKHVLPELGKRCAERDVEFSFIDLRWGITDEQVAEGRVLPICLDEIERCRPFFVGLLGEYYGSVPDGISPELVLLYPWLSDAKGRSVTDLEMSAVLHDSASAFRTFFYFRDRAYLQRLSESLREEWTSTAESAAMLRQLKERVQKKASTVTDYSEPESLTELVVDQLWTAIESEFPLQSESEAWRKETLQHAHFLHRHTRVYVGRRLTLRRLTDHVREYGPPLVVIGDAGTGKSALLANWLAEQSPASLDMPLVLHAVGATPESDRWEAMLIRLMTWMQKQVAIDLQIPTESDELLLAFPRFLCAVSAQTSLLMVIDGPDELQDQGELPPWGWLPTEIPENIRVIVTLRSSSPLRAEARARGWAELPVAELSQTERRVLIEGYLGRGGRKLKEEDLAEITNSPRTGMPLYLRLLLQELCVFGVYEQLSLRIRRYLQAPTLEALYGEIFRRWEEDYGADMVRQALSLIAVSRRGLLEQDLQWMLRTRDEPLTSVRWSPFFLSAELDISPRPGVLALTNEHVARAIRKVYLANDDALCARQMLIEFYSATTMVTLHFVNGVETRIPMLLDVRKTYRGFSTHAYEELPWQYVLSDRWRDLFQLLKNENFLKWATENCPWNIRRWWRELTERGYCAAKAFEWHLERLDEIEPSRLETIAEILQQNGQLADAKRVREALEVVYRRTGEGRLLGWSLLTAR